MTLYNLVDRFTQPPLWLREQLWIQWAVLATIASLSFLLLALLARRRRRSITGMTLAGHSSGGSLGSHLELAGLELSRRDIDDSTIGGAAQTNLRQQNWAHTAAQSQWADTPIRLLRREIIKRDQTEARLERELAGLKAANEQLRKRVAEGREMSERLRGKITELAEVTEQPRDQVSKPEQAGRQERYPGHEDQPRVIVEVEQKECRRCKQQKARSEFHKNASSSDGLSRWCKVCKAEAAQESRQQRATAPKQCRKCKQQKVRSEFHKNASSSDGLSRWCKVCKAEAERESRQRRASVRRTSRQPSGVCADAPLCALHHRQADRLKRARRRRPRDAEQIGKGNRRFRSPLSSPGLHCPKK